VSGLVIWRDLRKYDALFLNRGAELALDPGIIIIIIIIINIKGWAIWPVPSPELQLLSPAFLRSSNCSLSLRTVVV
jgi:hypothetical protein